MEQKGLDLRGARVLDLGCGTGGSALFITEQLAPAEVVGVDVEAGGITKAAAAAAAAGLADRVSFRGDRARAGSDAPPSPALQHYEQVEGLGFGLASPDVYFAALRAGGFQRISYRDRTPWLRARSHHEMEQLDGALRPQLEASVGVAFLDHEVAVWRALCAVLDTAELGAGHWRAVKP